MRVTLVVSSNKYTGAAAVAEHWCRALQAAGRHARLVFVGGANLQRRLQDAPWGRPELRKERRIGDIRWNFSVLRRAAADSDVLLSFLPHDHFEIIAAGVHRRIPVIRCFRNPRHLRRDPLHTWLTRRCRAVMVPFTALADTAAALSSYRPTGHFPVPVDDRFFSETERRQARIAMKLPPDGPLLGAVGKLAAGRGFEHVVDAAARSTHDSRLLIVGHGEHQPALERRAADRGLAGRVHWAGKREADLPPLIRAMDALFFPAPGSDWGHRVVTEAQACRTPVLAVPVPGVEDLLTDGATGIITPTPGATASAFDRLVGDPSRTEDLTQRARNEAETRRMPIVGSALHRFLEALVDAPCLTGDEE